MPPSVLLLPGNDPLKSNVAKIKNQEIAQSHSSWHCAQHFHPASSCTVRDVQKRAQTCHVKEPRSGKSALLTFYLSLLKQEEKCFPHNFGSTLVSNSSGKCCLAVSFHCKKIKQDTRWSICAVTYPAILLNTEQQKKSMSNAPHSLYTSEGMPCGVKAEKTWDTFNLWAGFLSTGSIPKILSNSATPFHTFLCTFFVTSCK